jgi:phosphopantetheinyl transferase
MWTPCSLIKEFKPNLIFLNNVDIVINTLKIRKTSLGNCLPDISNIELINKDEINKFKTAKRCEEHATGRYLLYQMLIKYYPLIDYTCVEVCRDENRAPFLKWIDGTFNSKPLPNFSISTSGNLAIVALSSPEYVVGIDIEKLNEKRSNNLLQFMSSGLELEKTLEIYKSGENYRINQLWTTKESLLKALRLGMSISPTKIKVIELDFKFKSIVEYKYFKLYLKTLIMDYGEKYSFSIAYRITQKNEFETLNPSELELKKSLSAKLKNGQYNFNVGCSAN